MSSYEPFFFQNWRKHLFSPISSSCVSVPRKTLFKVSSSISRIKTLCHRWPIAFRWVLYAATGGRFTKACPRLFLDILEWVPALGFLIGTLGLSMGCDSHHTRHETQGPFRLSLFQEPSHLDPALGRSSSNQYLIFNLQRGLYRWTEDNQLVSEGGRCAWESPLKLRCEIFTHHRWSDGTAVSAEDYKRAFEHLMDKKSPKPRSYLLSRLAKHYFHILPNKKSQEQQSLQNRPSSLPAESTSSGPVNRHFEVNFKDPDADFIEKLTSTALTPKHKNFKHQKSFLDHVGTGPYRIKAYVKGQKVTLTSNSFYPSGASERPDVVFYFIKDDKTALRLYRKKQLDFLRRLPFSFIRKYKGRNDFFQKPVARFDYIGFGPRLAKRRDLRKRLAHGLDYSESQILLSALGPLGCSSLPPQFYHHEDCYTFRRPLHNLPLLQSTDPTANNLGALTYGYSHLGGPILQLQGEWLQAQWRNNIGQIVQLKPMEQKSYLRTLRSHPPDLFRKGVGLDYPSCKAALEVFSKTNPKNYSKVSIPELEALLKEYDQTFLRAKKKEICSQGLNLLMKDFWYIPMGKMHFSLLASPRFRGWTLNSLNQLDLSHLRRSNH